MQTFGIKIEALDTLFFRDGRPFTASSRAETALPTPQTLAGAMRSYFLKKMDCDFQALGQAIKDQASFTEALADQGLDAIAQIKIRGPWLADLKNDQVNVFLPAPNILRQIKKQSGIKRLYPYKGHLSGWDPPLEGMLPLWLKERVNVEALSGYVNLESMQAILKGETPSSAQIKPAGSLFDYEERTGIGVQADQQSAEDGLIYAVKLLRLETDIGFYAELDLPDSVSSLVDQSHFLISFGGEGRRVACQTITPIAWPDAIQPQANQLIIRVLTSPALIEMADFLENWKVKAAALSPWQAVSGWDLALGGPKALRWALPAGSCLFFEPNSTIPELFCSDENAQIGWGSYLEGVSNYV